MNKTALAWYLFGMAALILAMTLTYCLVESDVARLRADNARLRAAIATERVRTDALEAEVRR